MTIYVAENRRICPNCGEPLTDGPSHNWDTSKRCSTESGCKLTFVVGEYTGREILQLEQDNASDETEQSKGWFKSMKTRAKEKWG